MLRITGTVYKSRCIYGNTYHRVVFQVNGGPKKQTPVTYGYDDHYICTLGKALGLEDGYEIRHKARLDIKDPGFYANDAAIFGGFFDDID